VENAKATIKWSGGARFRSRPYRPAGCRTRSKPAADANRASLHPAPWRFQGCLRSIIHPQGLPNYPDGVLRWEMRALATTAVAPYRSQPLRRRSDSERHYPGLHPVGFDEGRGVWSRNKFDEGPLLGPSTPLDRAPASGLLNAVHPGPSSARGVYSISIERGSITPLPLLGTKCGSGSAYSRETLPYRDGSKRSDMRPPVVIAPNLKFRLGHLDDIHIEPFQSSTLPRIANRTLLTKN
jgi:hypothetical protein